MQQPQDKHPSNKLKDLSTPPLLAFPSCLSKSYSVLLLLTLTPMCLLTSLLASLSFAYSKMLLFLKHILSIDSVFHHKVNGKMEYAVWVL